MASERGYYRSEIRRALNNLDMTLTHLVRMIPVYSVPHPEVASQLDEICEALLLVEKALLKVHDSI